MDILKDLFSFLVMCSCYPKGGVFMSGGIHEGSRTPGGRTIDVYEVPDVTVGYKLVSFAIRQCMRLITEPSI